MCVSHIQTHPHSCCINKLETLKYLLFTCKIVYFPCTNTSKHTIEPSPTHVLSMLSQHATQNITPYQYIQSIKNFYTIDTTYTTMCNSCTGCHTKLWVDICDRHVKAIYVSQHNLVNMMAHLAKVRATARNVFFASDTGLFPQRLWHLNLYELRAIIQIM